MQPTPIPHGSSARGFGWDLAANDSRRGNGRGAIRHARRRLRNFLARLVGVQADLQIWWTPDFPVVYISNPKCGCSTVKHSLKAAQAQVYARSGRTFVRAEDPHIKDDCLRLSWLAPRACRQRYLISTVRNPFTRALSGFLDKVGRPGTVLLPEFGYRRVDDFESYLQALARCDPINTNSHFRPQHVNLDYPRVGYDGIFFLENLSALPHYLSTICPEFQLETFAPHSRGARSKLAEHYTDRAVDLVRDIFAKDFELFGYSRDLEDADAAPGEMIASGWLQPARAETLGWPPRPQHATPGTPFEKTLRYRRLVDMHLI
jgi:hypothetical protein